MLFDRLKKLGILGMNSRIGHFMAPLNPRANYPRVDNKVETARLAAENDLPTPPIRFVFSSFGQLSRLDEILEPYPAFVIKPARGAMGNGIIVIQDTREGIYYKTSGEPVRLEDLRYQISSTLSGLYSLGGLPDEAILQYKIRLHSAFAGVAINGIPDIRIIVYQGYPVMGMIRLPTFQSDGRANLHQGAIGLGVHMTAGYTTSAIHRNRIITHHVDNGRELARLPIPFWDRILLMAARSFEVAGLGYLGVDIALDQDLGPLVLEMNARPGLSIQIANLIGLRGLLSYFQPRLRADLPPAERVALARQWLDEFYRERPPTH